MGGLSGTSTTELGVGLSRRLVVAAEVVREGGEGGAVDEAARVGLEPEREGLLVAVTACGKNIVATQWREVVARPKPRWRRCRRRRGGPSCS